jgi:hypothetical protein
VDAPVERAYPHVSEWVKAHGWIEIGYDDFSRSFIRVLNIGGMIWEGQESYASLDDALQAAEHELQVWIRKQYGD